MEILRFLEKYKSRLTTHKMENKTKEDKLTAEDFYESIEKYKDRQELLKEFEAAFKPEEIEYDKEKKLYKWLRDNKM